MTKDEYIHELEKKVTKLQIALLRCLSEVTKMHCGKPSCTVKDFEKLIDDILAEVTLTK